MTEPAEMGSTAVPEEKPEPPRPEHVREFDASLCRALPGMDKDEMQHLIEHKEEMSARLECFGLKMRRSFRSEMMHEHTLELWNDFYVESFDVTPDFSRIYIPDNKAHFTYVQPIFVAPLISFGQLLSVLEAYGVDCSSIDKAPHPWSEASRVNPYQSDNYMAAFSPEIHERVPKKIIDVNKYQAEHMSLREYLLYLAYCMYHIKKSGLESLGKSSVEPCFGNFLLPGTTLSETLMGTKADTRPAYLRLLLAKDMRLHVGTCEYWSVSQNYSMFEPGINGDKIPRGVRRVKLYKTPKRI